MALIGISPMICNIELLFMYLLAICLLSLDKHLVRVLPIFKPCDHFKLLVSCGSQETYRRSPDLELGDLGPVSWIAAEHTSLPRENLGFGGSLPAVRC